MMVYIFLLFYLSLFHLSLIEPPENQEGNDQEHDYQRIGDDADHGTPYGCLLGRCADDRWVKADDDEVGVAADVNSVDDLSPRHVEHGDVATIEGDKA